MIAEGESIACPFKMLKRYIDLIGIDLSSDQFLFKPMFNSGGKCKLIYKNKPLSYTRAKECILAKLHKIDPNLNLGLHSLRAGVRPRQPILKLSMTDVGNAMVVGERILVKMVM